MDPNANLTEQLALTKRILNDSSLEGDALAQAAERLAELVEAQCAWLESGGFLPEAWAR